MVVFLDPFNLVGRGMALAGTEAWGGLVACRDGAASDEVDGFCALAGNVSLARATCTWLDASQEDGYGEGYYCACWDFLRGKGCETNDEPWRLLILTWEVCLTAIPSLVCFVFSFYKAAKFKREQATPNALQCIRLSAVGSFFLALSTLSDVMWLGANVYERWNELTYALSVPLTLLPVAVGYVLQIFAFEEVLASVPSERKQPRRLGRRGSIGLVLVSVAFATAAGLTILALDYLTMTMLALPYSLLIASLYLRAALQFKKMLQDFAQLHCAANPQSRSSRDELQESIRLALRFIRWTTILSSIVVLLALCRFILSRGKSVLVLAYPARYAVYEIVQNSAIWSTICGLLCLLAWYSASILDKLQQGRTNVKRSQVAPRPL